MKKIISKNELFNIATENKVSRRDTLLIVSHVLNISYTDSFFSKTFQINEIQYEKIQNAIKRRSQQEPISKIINKKEFYGIEYKTSEFTLDPRPETELLIDLFQKYFPDKFRPLEILDLGTGTGCIGLTILNLYQNAKADLSDISKDALSIAKYNAQNLNLSNRCEFIESNWFQNISKRYNAILSNPPYISTNFKLDKQTSYDPPLALFAGIDGLEAYREILPKASDFLTHGGYLFLEIGFDQKEKIENIDKKLILIEVKRDLAGHNRSMVFRV